MPLRWREFPNVGVFEEKSVGEANKSNRSPIGCHTLQVSYKVGWDWQLIGRAKDLKSIRNLEGHWIVQSLTNWFIEREGKKI